ncbi:hypothetical protein JCM6882_002158 [Rhodosporidiobolus microsporus]
MTPLKHPLPTDSKHPLLPTSAGTPLPRRTRSLPRWAIALLTLASIGALYAQYGPDLAGSEGDHFSPDLAAYYRHIRRDLPSTCPHAQKEHKRLSLEEVEHAILTFPTAEGARNASHSYTSKTHVAGSPGDKNIALLLKAQWEGLLGVAPSGEEGNVWDAGTEEDYEALTGGKKGGKGKKGRKGGSHHKGRRGLVRRAKRAARHALEGAGLPVPSFLARRGHGHHGGKKQHLPPVVPRVWTSRYYPLLDTPIHSSVSYSSPSTNTSFSAKLKENVLAEDPTSGEGVKAWHGFSNNGSARGEVVYASKGRPEDYDELEAKGITVKDRIALVQYGSLFRGNKVKAAAERGARAVLIYSDPIEDGEVTVEKGVEPFPKGGAREPSSIQRGSVQYLSLYPGDPLTPSLPAYNPHNPSLPHIPRLPNSSPSLNKPPIPSLPLSYEDALPLLLELNGRGVKLEDGREGRPEGWREGGLGYRGVEYWTGPSEGVVEVVNGVEEEVTAIWNTYALIPGQVDDEIVVLGNHHDAWTFGSGDPSSGTAAMHEVVKAFGALLKKGWRPLRTVLVVGWDAEEYGLIGSTEFGEDFASYLQSHVVAYLNVDVAAAGTGLELNASPSLADLMREVASRVDDPDREGRKVGERGEGEGELEVDALGSGSDFTVFLQRLGLASLSLGYAPNGKTDPVYHYHSNFDDAYWMDRFGDPQFKHHEAVAKLLGLAAVRLVEEGVVPINTTAYAVALSSYVDKITTLPGASSLDLSPLRSLASDILSASQTLHARAADLLSRLRSPHAHSRSGAKGRKDALKLVKELREVNEKLRRFEGGFLGDGKGLKGREWYRHLGVAPGRYLGYGATTLPGLAEALTLDHDVEQAKEEVVRLERAFEGILEGLKGKGKKGGK